MKMDIGVFGFDKLGKIGSSVAYSYSDLPVLTLQNAVCKIIVDKYQAPTPTQRLPCNESETPFL